MRDIVADERRGAGPKPTRALGVAPRNPLASVVSLAGAITMHQPHPIRL